MCEYIFFGEMRRGGWVRGWRVRRRKLREMVGGMRGISAVRYRYVHDVEFVNCQMQQRSRDMRI